MDTQPGVVASAQWRSSKRKIIHKRASCDSQTCTSAALESGNPIRLVLTDGPRPDVVVDHEIKFFTRAELDALDHKPAPSSAPSAASLEVDVKVEADL